MPSPCDRHRPSPASCTRSFPIRRTTRPVDPAWRHEIVNFAVPSVHQSRSVSIRRAPNRRIGGGGRDWKDKPVKRGDKKVPNIGGKFLSHRRSRPSKICLAAVGRRFLGSRTGTFAFFFRDRLRPAGRALDTTRVSAPTGSPRTRSHRQATRPALGRKALKGPTRTRTNPTQGRGEILSRDIIQRLRR